MKYQSTRNIQGQQDLLSFEQVTLAGLARDGGLYVPVEWPSFSADEIANMAGLSYADVAFRVLKPFVTGSLDDDTLQSLIADSYGPQFAHKAVAPLSQLDQNKYLLELFHGPTLAFKDFALQLLGRLFDQFTAKEDKQITILGATSGDTGSAAIEATRGRSHVSIFMLHPKGRVSEVQRRQMTTITDPNVVNLAVEGTFDDCQALVKESFNDLAFRDGVNLTAVNSINWARVMAQVVYYFTAAVSLGAPHRAINFVVPTGNFGDIYAGFVARKMGLPINKLVVATNSNDILARTIKTGRYQKGDVSPTLSPSMDIQVSSNFERLLYEVSGRDGQSVASRLKGFETAGYFDLTEAELTAIRDVFDAARVDDTETSRIMKQVLLDTGMVIDPHTAVGVGAADQCLKGASEPTVILATAHPAKFGAAVKQATGIDPQLPAHMADLYDRPEKFDGIDNDGPMLRAMIQKFQENKKCK